MFLQETPGKYVVRCLIGHDEDLVQDNVSERGLNVLPLISKYVYKNRKTTLGERPQAYSIVGLSLRKGFASFNMRVSANGNGINAENEIKQCVNPVYLN